MRRVRKLVNTIFRSTGVEPRDKKSSSTTAPKIVYSNNNTDTITINSETMTVTKDTDSAISLQSSLAAMDIQGTSRSTSDVEMLADDSVRSSIIKVHELTNDPTTFWNTYSGQNSNCYQRINENEWNAAHQTPMSNDKIRVVCISDTHNCLDRISKDIPNGDILIHAGDFTFRGSPGEVKDFAVQLARLPHKYKLIIAGNHEMSFEPENRLPYFGTTIEDELRKYNVTNVRDFLKPFTYLQDTGVQIYGYNFYGAPWQPEYGSSAYSLTRGQECLEKWNQIPTETDILITHGPPVGHGDAVGEDTAVTHAGCVELLTTVEQRVRPLFHVFGHIHEGYGISTNGTTTFINASTCTRRFQASNAPIVFDLPVKIGHSKL